MLIDHDTMLTALWEVREVCELASAAPNVDSQQGNPGADAPLPLDPRKNAWVHGLEGNRAYCPGNHNTLAAVLVSETKWDTNAGLVIFLADSSNP